MSAFSIERVERTGVLTFDEPGKPINTLSRETGAELLDRLAELEADASVEAVVLISGKADTFIAGADIHEFAALTSAAEGQRLAVEAQHLTNVIARSRKPIVAAIHGACLGGGLEVALAARARIASGAATTRLGQPEVQLGVIPAAGGCQRLPRLVGTSAALDLILTGRQIDAARALRLGLLDEVVPLVILRRAAIEAASRLAGGRPGRPHRRRRMKLTALLDGTPPGRQLALRQAAARVRARTGQHYPAPFAAIDAVREGWTRGIHAGLAREAEHFGQLAVGPVSRHLVQVFFATAALKKEAGLDLDAAGGGTVERLGVVGSGFMGAAIAGVAALKAGIDTRLRDTDADRVARGVVAARGVLDEAVRRRRLDPHERSRREALISGTTDYSGFARRDLAIEAVFEDADVKRRVFAELETVVPDDCVIASNTSTLSISALQHGMGRPQRIVGLHFFSPVEKMPLVEVIGGNATDERAIATAVRFARQLEKTAVIVRDAPGFWVNRLLGPYLNEAGWLVHDGASLASVDEAMTRFGFPVGPFTLLDEVGLDVAAKASAVLHEALGDRLAPSPGLAVLVHKGRLGRKSGRGFYRWVRGARRRDPEAARLVSSPRTAPPPAAEIESRLVLAMLNEAAYAFAEGVVREARDGDMGAILGFGFPPFLGGPLRHIDDRGASTVVGELDRHADRIGPRFAPAGILQEMARAGGRFYGGGA